MCIYKWWNLFQVSVVLPSRQSRTALEVGKCLTLVQASVFSVCLAMRSWGIITVSAKTTTSGVTKHQFVDVRFALWWPGFVFNSICLQPDNMELKQAGNTKLWFCYTTINMTVFILSTSIRMKSHIQYNTMCSYLLILFPSVSHGPVQVRSQHSQLYTLSGEHGDIQHGLTIVLLCTRPPGDWKRWWM